MERRNLLLIDNGPLRELIHFQAVFTLNFSNLHKGLSFVSEKLPYDKLSSFIGSFQRKITTPYVILELGHWVRETKHAGRERIWSLVYEELQRMGLAEQMIKLLDMPRELVARYGPTDVSLLRLAQKYVNSDPVVLTIDQELWSECWKANIRAVHIHEIIRPDVA